jgi:hypothetical protein
MFLRIIFGTMLLALLATNVMGQSPEYSKLIQKAEALVNSKKYKEAAVAYGKAFATLGGKANVNDRYNAACAWALAGNKDSAFYHLNYLASKGKYEVYKDVQDDEDLKSLHTDKRWDGLLAQLKKLSDAAMAKLNKPLVAQLATILENDQKYRLSLDSIGEKYGQFSKEVEEVWATIALHDSLNEIEVVSILEKYGWPGKDMVGEEGAETIFLVIQHADLAIQDKYLPMMRDAVKKGNANAGSLALLEDRVAIRHGNRQIYGSQISGGANGAYLLPMTDPDNVDKRRAAVGLGPLADYLQNWQLKWDVTSYKQQLPELEAAIAAGKNPEYRKLIKKADDLYTAKQYKESAEMFGQAFALTGGIATPDDRYNLACSWALAGSKDSAFYQLQYLADHVKYRNYSQLQEDTDLASLHNDKRWAALCKRVKQNKEKAETKRK